MATCELKEGLLLGVGNPLLDMQVTVDKAYLDKWNLKENDAILAEDKHVPMFDELNKRKDVVYVPGGSTQNSIRVAAWVWGRPNVGAFMGCIGNDEYGDILEKKAREAGVNVRYQRNETTKTGTCAVLIYQHHRSLAAHLAAANCFTIEHLDVPENKALIENAQFYYIAGFHLTVCPPGIMRIARHALEHNKPFCMNLSAPFISQFFKQPLLDALPYVNILFGNETEAATFAEVNELGTTDVSEIALKIAAWPKKSDRERIVVITQGSEEVIVAQNGKINKYPVTKMPKEKIVDTNGAGDSFVGGFLAQLVRGADIADCVRCGVYAATVCLQNSGCTMPGKCDFK